MIEINNLTTSRVNKKFLEKIAEVVLKKENIREINLSIALVGQERIKALNKKYRGKQRVADVLAFPYRASGGGEDEEENKVFFAHDDSGEIVICLREVKKNAKKFKSTYKKELAQVIIHGILHLLGYTHEKSSTRAKLGAGLVPHRNKVSGAGSKKEAKEVEETKASSSPFAAARVMEEKQNYYLRLCQKII